MIGHQGIPVGRLPGLGIMRPSMKAGSESKPAKSGLPCRTSHSIKPRRGNAGSKYGALSGRFPDSSVWLVSRETWFLPLRLLRRNAQDL